MPVRFADRIVKATKGSGRRTILLTGASGTGKTYQFRTLVEGGLRCLYVDVEAKSTSVDDVIEHKYLIRNLDVPLNPHEKQQMLHEGTSDLTLLCDGIRYDEHDFDVVYFDSLMRYSETLVHHLKHNAKLSGYDLWGVFAEKMKMALVMLTSMASDEYKRPVHVIGTWGVEMGRDWKGQALQLPIVDGKVVGPRIPYFFDDVIHLVKNEDAETKTINFIAYTAGTQSFTAKVSAGPGKVPPIVGEPNLFKIIEHIKKVTA